MTIHLLTIVSTNRPFQLKPILPLLLKYDLILLATESTTNKTQVGQKPAISASTSNKEPPPTTTTTTTTNNNNKYPNDAPPSPSASFNTDEDGSDDERSPTSSSNSSSGSGKLSETAPRWFGANAKADFASQHGPTAYQY